MVRRRVKAFIMLQKEIEKRKRKDISMHYGKPMKKSSKKKKNYVCDGMDVKKAPKVKKEPTEKVM